MNLWQHSLCGKVVAMPDDWRPEADEGSACPVCPGIPDPSEWQPLYTRRRTS